ncbi:MAG: hypothetical protein KC501_25035 [Myxococcales bacterium]|nr:hypothetical protein [Myxococcales bacterium]
MKDAELERACNGWWRGDGAALRRHLVKELRLGHLVPVSDAEGDTASTRRMIDLLMTLTGAAFRAGWEARERMEAAEGKPLDLFGPAR